MALQADSLPQEIFGEAEESISALALHQWTEPNAYFFGFAYFANPPLYWLSFVLFFWFVLFDIP